MKHLIEWLRERRTPPAVVISRSGQLTDRPQVHVSIGSRRGSQGVYTFDANEVGEASAEMHGKSLANIAGLRLIDARS